MPEFSFAALLLAVFPALMIAAAASDAATMTIPNRLCAALALAFVPAAFALGLSPVQVGIHAGVGFAALLVMAGLFAMNWIGGGDAKLFAAAAVWFGWPDVLNFLLWTGLTGGVLSLALLSGRRLAPVLAGRGPAWVDRLLTPGGDVPYGVALAAGALIAFPSSALFGAISSAT